MRSLKAFLIGMGAGLTVLLHGVPSQAFARPMPHSGWYSTGPLAGHRGVDLYAAYLNLNARNTVIPTRLYVDWDQRLTALWEAKPSKRSTNAELSRLATKLVHEYRAGDPGRMSLTSYQQIANQEAHVLHARLDWKKLGKIYGLDQRRQDLLRNTSGHIGGRSLIAYMMAELLPSRFDGQFNRDYLDFLLRHGGRRFVESIPAENDGDISFGTYQITSYALSDVNGKQIGASKVNRALPTDLQIPGSVNQLRSDDHFDAAYLFAVSNLADLIRSLNARELQTFERVRTNDADLAEFIATAHNKPAVARDAGRRWLSNKARLPFRDSIKKSASRIYADKTHSNWDALLPSTQRR